MKPKLVVIGHVMEEMIEFPSHTAGPVLGGVAAYFSVIAAKLGGRIGVVTKIGSDMPRHLLDPLYEIGLDTRGMVMEGSESRHSLLIYDENGNKTMQYPQEGRSITFRDIPEDYLEADIIYIAPEEGEIAFSVVERLSLLQKKLAVDLGGYGGAHCSRHTANQEEILRQILPHFEIAKLSREDCRYLFPGTCFEAEKIARLLVEWGAKIVVLTLAGEGVVIAVGNDQVFGIPASSSRPVDCTGAGDAFAAGFLFSYHRGKSVREAGLFASVTSSLVIEKTGGIALERMPSLSEVQERMSQFQENISCGGKSYG